MRRHVENPVPRVRDLVPNCPAALSDLIGKLLSKDRNDRPRSASDVADALQRILQAPEAPLDMSTLPIKLETSESEDDENSSEKAHLTERLRVGNSAAASEVSTGTLVALGLAIVAIIIVAAIFGSSGA